MQLTLPNDTPLEVLNRGLKAMNLEVLKLRTCDDGIHVITGHRETDNIAVLPAKRRQQAITRQHETR